jgi:DNA-binding MurR/RpiR family transcriptional regulator
VTIDAVPVAIPAGGLVGRIRVRRDSLFPAEARVAAIVLESPERVIQMPISRLAELAEVSEGTVVRFCQTVGFEGYHALKLALAMDLAQPGRVIHEDIDAADDPETVARKVFATDIRALEDTLAVVDPGEIARAVEAIATAARLEVFGVGSSLAVAFDAYTRFLRIGVPLGLELDTHLQVMRASGLGSGDVGLAISHSGRSREPVECLALARHKGATTIAITGRQPSPLTEQADIVLVTVSSETSYREEAMASRIAQLSLLDTLFVAVAIRRPEQAVGELRRTSEALAPHRI